MKYSKLILAVGTALFVGSQSVASTVTYTASISEVLPYTFTGTIGSATAAVLPQFSASLGTLNSVTISQSNYVSIDAKSVVEAGEYIQGKNVSVWNWAVDTGFALAAPGASDTGSYVTFSAYGEYDSPQTPESAEVSFSTIVVGNVLSVDPTHLSSYVGSGTVGATLEIGISTAIPPLPATLAGFTWQLLGKNIAGGIAMGDTDTVIVSYDYTPPAPPIAATPEPKSVELAGLALVLLLAYRWFAAKRTPMSVPATRGSADRAG